MMNPITLMLDNEGVVFQLTEADYKRLTKTRLVDGGSGPTQILMHQMCVMQAVSMVSVEADKEIIASRGRRTGGYTDKPVCVSSVITNYLIELNDSDITPRQRNSLKKVIPDILNTCPIRRRTLKDGRISDTRKPTPEYRAAEEKRAEILARIPNIDDEGEPTKVSVAKRLELVREAAAVLQMQPVTEVVESAPALPVTITPPVQDTNSEPTTKQ